MESGVGSRFWVGGIAWGQGGGDEGVGVEGLESGGCSWFEIIYLKSRVVDLQVLCSFLCCFQLSYLVA